MTSCLFDFKVFMVFGGYIKDKQGCNGLLPDGFGSGRHSIVSKLALESEEDSVGMVVFMNCFEFLRKF